MTNCEFNPRMPLSMPWTRTEEETAAMADIARNILSARPTVPQGAEPRILRPDGLDSVEEALAEIMYANREASASLPFTASDVAAFAAQIERESIGQRRPEIFERSARGKGGNETDGWVILAQRRAAWLAFADWKGIKTSDLPQARRIAVDEMVGASYLFGKKCGKEAFLAILDKYAPRVSAIPHSQRACFLQELHDAELEWAFA